MNIIILGAGPAGLYGGLLIQKAHPDYTITVLERNPADVTYGWGVVFSDRTLASFQIFLGVMAIYFVVCYPLSLLARWWERRMVVIQ